MYVWSVDLCMIAPYSSTPTQSNSRQNFSLADNFGWLSYININTLKCRMLHHILHRYKHIIEHLGSTAQTILYCLVINIAVVSSMVKTLPDNCQTTTLELMEVTSKLIWHQTGIRTFRFGFKSSSSVTALSAIAVWGHEVRRCASVNPCFYRSQTVIAAYKDHNVVGCDKIYGLQDSLEYGHVRRA